MEQGRAMALWAGQHEDEGTVDCGWYVVPTRGPEPFPYALIIIIDIIDTLHCC